MIRVTSQLASRLRQNASRHRRQASAAHPGARRGIASLLVMLYMVLFAALALGFYAATTMSSQLSRNEQQISEAQLATESGVQFTRFYLGTMDLPSNTTNA